MHLPDVRDGLKPVHRRILYAMNDLGITADKAYKNRLVLLGMLWVNITHMVTQPFMKQWYVWHKILVNVICLLMDMVTSVLLMVIERLQCVIQKQECLKFRWNYYGILIKIQLIIKITMMVMKKSQLYYHARFPNLLVNGASGIAVGMATNIPPHQLR